MGFESIKEKRMEKKAAKQSSQENQNATRADNDVAPLKLYLLLTVVDKRKAEYYADLIQSFDVNMQVGTLAKGMTMDTSLLEYFGLDKSDKVAIFSFVREDKVNELMDTLEEKFRSIKGGEGISTSIPFSSVMGKLVYGFLSNNEKIIQEEKRK